MVAERRNARQAFAADEVINVLGKQQRKEEAARRVVAGDCLTVGDIAALPVVSLADGAIWRR